MRALLVALAVSMSGCTTTTAVKGPKVIDTPVVFPAPGEPDKEELFVCMWLEEFEGHFTCIPKSVLDASLGATPTPSRRNNVEL